MWGCYQYVKWISDAFLRLFAKKLLKKREWAFLQNFQLAKLVLNKLKKIA